MDSRLVLAILCISGLVGCSPSKRKAAIKVSPDYEPFSGDFVFQSLPRNPLIDAIEGATGSPFSHCGIVVNRNGTWKVLEAIGPVKETPLPVWIAQGRNSAYVAYRLRYPLAVDVEKIIAAAERYKGRPYDLRYDLDDAKIYCSELIWKATKDAVGVTLGRLQKLGELRWHGHESVIRTLENGGLPLEREMITPRALTEDSRLMEVYRFRM